MTRRRYQGSDAWLEERKGGIGASEVPTLVLGTEARWREVFAVKLGILPDPPATEAMAIGKRLEDFIAELYVEKAGEKVRRVDRVLRHREHPIIRASLDRYRAGLVVQLKSRTHQSDEWGPDGSEQVPDAVFYQEQQEMLVAGVDRADVAVLFGANRLHVYHLGRDKAICDELIELELAAWAYVERGEVPPYPGPAAVRPQLAADEVEIDVDLATHIAIAIEAGRQAALYEQTETEAKDRIRTALETAGGAKGFLIDGTRASVAYRPTKDRVTVGHEQIAAAYRKAALEAGADPDRLDAIASLFTRSEPGNRPLRITVKQEALTHAA